MTPSLDRAELAARLAEADWRNPRAEPLPLGEWGRTLVAYADDLIAALALTPPVAGPCPGEDARDDAEARKRIAGRPPIVCLCGSTRFIDTFQSEYGRLTDEGNIVLSVGRVVPQSEQALGSERKVALDALHLRKIDLCDRVLVLNVGGYVGPSTRREIAYAKAHSKPVDLLYPDAGLDGQPPVAPKSEAVYVPKVGDVVRFKDSVALWVVDGRVPSNRYFTVGITDAVKGSRGCCDPHELTYVRESTDAEKRLAGLPSPEATRPTHVRYVKAYHTMNATIARPVLRWNGANPVVRPSFHPGTLDDANELELLDGEWEPAPATVEPAKGEARDEALRVARDAITLDDVDWWLETLGRSFEQGTDVGANSIKRLEALRDALAARGGS